MWKQRANELKDWLPVTPRYAVGAKSFLQSRFGVTPPVPFTPVCAFGLELRDPEINCAPVDEDRGADLAGARN